jgi:SAM-dependent methyltransferase
MIAESGEEKLTIVDKFGRRLSRRPILDVARRYSRPAVLDVGCGHRAAILVELAPTIARGVGIDRSVCKEAKRIANLEALEEEAEAALARLDPSSFDIVLMISVLEHMWEPVSALAACHRVLRPGGSLVVNVPTWPGKAALELSAFRLGWSSAASIDDHKTYYSKRELWPQMVRAGFRPSRIRMSYQKLGLNLFAVAVKM